MEKWLLISILSCLALSGVMSESEVDLQITQRYARPGEAVTLNCEISNIQGSSLTFYAKTVVLNRERPLEPEPIGAGSDLLGDYQSAGRFELTSSPMDDTALLLLKINNVKYEDSGLYTCGVVNDASRGSALFEVYRNTEYLAFHVNGTEVTNNTIVDLEENEGTPLACLASKAVPEPQLYLHSGNREITNNFAKNHYPVPDCVDETPCVLHFYYNASASNMQYMPTWQDNGEVMMCKAIIPEKETEYHHGFDIKFTTMRLNVTHAPQVNCSEKYVGERELSKTIRCPVFSNPDLQSDQLLLSTTNNYIKLYPGQSNQGVTFKYAEKQDTKRPGLVGEVEVTFNSLQNNHFTKYIIESRNVIGERTNTFQLEEGDDDEGGHDPNGAPINQISFFSLIVMAAMAIFSH